MTIPGDEPMEEKVPMAGGSPKRGFRRRLLGKVVGDRMNKTRVVEVRRIVREPRFGKYMMRKKKYYAHDEENKSHIGDVVVLKESRPLSRLKRWIVVEVKAKAPDLMESREVTR